MHSFGLHAAVAACEPLGDLLVVAPIAQQTAAGRSKPVSSTGRLTRVEIHVHDRIIPAYGVDASPAQAVEHALFELAPRPVDLVVSGINYGENVGEGLAVSGTLGASAIIGALGILLGSIPIAIRDRYRERQYLRDAAKMKAQTQKGEKIEIRRGQDFIAANEFAVANYTPKPLPVPVTIYRSNENFFDTEESIRRGLGWDRVALAGYEVIDVPGGHLTMLDEPHVKTLAGHIAHGMAKS